MGASTLTAAIDRALKERGHRPGLPRAFAVLRGFLAAGFRPRYILVEAHEDLPSDDALLGPHGYERLARFHSDAIYWRAP